jgi:hypothetical protein
MTRIPDSSLRAGKLYGLFRDVVAGKRELKTPNDAKLFLEAVCGQQPATTCIERIVSTPGMKAVRSCVRADLSPNFIQSSTLKFIEYLSDPGIQLLADGQLLQDIVLVIVEPPTVWRALVNLFLAHKLPEDCIKSFAWLVHEVICLPSTLDLDLSEDVKAVIQDDALVRSSTHEIRELGYKIKHALELKSTAHSSSETDDAPGGRHDNDFTDFRKIHLYPTTDEFLSKVTPFYRTAHEVFGVEGKTTAAVHIDNQFRLLREDMLEEMRNDLQVAMGQKKGARKAMTLGALRPYGIGHGDDRRSKPCTLQLECYRGLEAIHKVHEDARRTYLMKDHTSYLRHDSFGVLLRGPTIIGFAFIERDIDLLIQTPSVVSLRFTDTNALGRALAALKTPHDVYFILVDTPVFAYEPVLNGLKNIGALPLEEHILQPSQAESDFKPVPVIRKIVARIEEAKDNEGCVLMPDDPSIRLDKSQVDSIVNALTSPVTLIQGPPGMLLLFSEIHFHSNGLSC